MEKTRHRNAVLIYLAPRSRKFAIIGDEAIHAKCGELFWQEVAALMSPLLGQERYTEAVEGAIQKIGAVLARHFPRDRDNPDELSNALIQE